MAASQLNQPPSKDSDVFDDWLIRFWKLVCGGGTGVNHASLSSLAWTSSGHTGTVSTIAGFDSSGNATNANLTGPVTSVGYATTITAASITYAMIQNLAAVSVIGRAANSSGVSAVIAGTAAQVLRVESNGSGLAFGALDISQAAAVTGLATGMATFLGTPSSANLKATVTDETGSGALVFANTPTLVTPILGAATGTSTVLTGAISSSSPSAGIGYATGAGAAVTQQTNRSTGVTINAICGQITGINTSLAAGAEAIFVVTNSSVALQDVVLICVQSGPTANTSVFFVSTVTAGTFSIRIRNLHATVADTGAPIINFCVIKAVKA